MFSALVANTPYYKTVFLDGATLHRRHSKQIEKFLTEITYK